MPAILGALGIRHKLVSARFDQPTTESALEQRWVESSQGSWVTRCGCGHWNTSEVLLEKGGAAPFYVLE
jgi:hypothetical protein